jgi:hypothetical protein
VQKIAGAGQNLISECKRPASVPVGLLRPCRIEVLSRVTTLTHPLESRLGVNPVISSANWALTASSTAT